MEHVIEEAAARLERGERFALAIITRSDGSTPRKVGSKMIVAPDRSIYATIGGGSPEAAAIDACVEALATGRSRTLAFDLTQGDVSVADPICGGEGTVMICVADGRQLPVFEALRAGAAEDRDLHLAVRIAAGEADFFALDAQSGEVVAPAGIEPDGALRVELARLADPLHASGEAADNAEWHCERVRREGLLYLLGGGHVSHATEAVARIAGFSCVVVDDREEFSNPARFPQARCIVMPGFAELASLRVTPDDYVVIATRGHSFDGICLDWALATPAGYIGMIGSARKVKLIFERMRSEGVPEETIARVHAPIGLPIGGNEPGEIAVSIVAQLIEERVARYGE